MNPLEVHLSVRMREMAQGQWLFNHHDAESPKGGLDGDRSTILILNLRWSSGAEEFPSVWNPHHSVRY
jgi:hypothetical protein